METPPTARPLAELAAAVGGTVEGDGAFLVHRPVPAGRDDPAGISYAANDGYLARVLASQVGALLVSLDAEGLDRPAIRVRDPRAAFGVVLALFRRPWPLEEGIHPTAVVSFDAEVHEDARIGAFCVIEAGARVEAGAQIHPFGYVGERCVVGPDTVLAPRVTLVQDVRLGSRCLVHSGAVLGADGFGFVWDGQRRVKVPQVGGILIGDDVEIGANTCIDRATCGDTVIGDGVKLDNLVQIAHNDTVGAHTVIAGLSALGGSVTVGQRATIGGQAAVSDHVTVADDVALGGRTGVVSDIKASGEYLGLPARPARETLRLWAMAGKLPELMRRVHELERELQRLKDGD